MSLLAVLVAPSAAGAAWSSPGSGGQWARAVSLSAGSQPSASAANRDVTVGWAATPLPGGAGVSGYTVRRYSSGGALQSTGAGCSGTVSATSCVESGVPPGTWRYAVVPRQGNWSGGESPLSSPVTVDAASLTVTSGDPVGALPATIGATLAGFLPGQTVSYRLDDPATGTLLTATTTPTPVPAGGGASASITIPAGTTGGSHTLYAVGSAGDVASATIDVDSTVATGAWKVTDASSGTPADASSVLAFANDGLVYRSDRFDSAFSTGRYLDVEPASPLPAGQTVSGAAFAFRFAAQATGQTACFYLELRRASTGAVLSTHGSAATPLGCVTGTGQQTFPTALPALTTSDLANDASVRVYVSQSSSRAVDVDMATISGTAALAPFTIHAGAWVDAADTSPATTTWPLAEEDAVAYQSAQNWATSFASARYLETTFPSYVPAGATVRSASLRHVWRPANAAQTACWYAETYSGGSLIGSHGSAAAPLACRTGAAYAVETVPLPEVNTPGRANDLTVRIYVRFTGGITRRTEHDLTRLSVQYGS